MNGRGTNSHQNPPYEGPLFGNPVELFYYRNRGSIDFVRKQLLRGTGIIVRNKTWIIDAAPNVLHREQPDDEHLRRVLCTKGVEMLTKGGGASGGPLLICTEDVAERFGVSVDAIVVLANMDCLGGVLRRRHRTYVLPIFVNKLAFSIGTLLSAGLDPQSVSADLRPSWRSHGRRS